MHASYCRISPGDRPSRPGSNPTLPVHRAVRTQQRSIAFTQTYVDYLIELYKLMPFAATLATQSLL